jgi:hypothetical protein
MRKHWILFSIQYKTDISLNKKIMNQIINIGIRNLSAITKSFIKIKSNPININTDE